jgi:recombination protein RecT
MASELAQRAAEVKPSERATARDLILRHQEEFDRALGRSMDTDHFVRGVLTSLTANPDLQTVTEQSLIAAVLLAAQLKLEIGAGMNQFHLTPRNVTVDVEEMVNGRAVKARRSQSVCVPIIGYQGYVKLGYNHPRVLDFQVIRVREGDEFDYSYTTERGKAISWRPTLPIDISKPYAGGVIRSALAGGGVIETYMHVSEIEAARPDYTKPKEGQDWVPNTPWKTNYEAMADKTIMRQHQKYMPKSIEMETALALDNRVLARVNGEVVTALPYEQEFGTPDAEPSPSTPAPPRGPEPTPQGPSADSSTGA